MSNPLKFKTFIAFCLTITCCYTKAQVTTSTISGSVTNTESKPLAGATVKISYANAGINKTTITQNDGSFVMPNLRVGGPYTVAVSFTGYKEKTEDNIMLELGQNTAIDVKLETASVNLAAGP